MKTSAFTVLRTSDRVTKITWKDIKESYNCCEHLNAQPDDADIDKIKKQLGVKKNGFDLCCNECYPEFLYPELGKVEP